MKILLVDTDKQSRNILADAILNKRPKAEIVQRPFFHAAENFSEFDVAFINRSKGQNTALLACMDDRLLPRQIVVTTAFSAGIQALTEPWEKKERALIEGRGWECVFKFEFAELLAFVQGGNNA